MNRDNGMMGSLRSPSWVMVFRVGMTLCVMCGMFDFSTFRTFRGCECGCDRDEREEDEK